MRQAADEYSCARRNNMTSVKPVCAQKRYVSQMVEARCPKYRDAVRHPLLTPLQGTVSLQVGVLTKSQAYEVMVSRCRRSPYRNDSQQDDPEARLYGASRIEIRPDDNVNRTMKPQISVPPAAPSKRCRHAKRLSRELTHHQTKHIQHDLVYHTSKPRKQGLETPNCNNANIERSS